MPLGALDAGTHLAGIGEGDVRRDEAMRTDSCPHGLIPPRQSGLEAGGKHTRFVLKARWEDAGSNDKAMWARHDDAGEKEGGNVPCEATFHGRYGLI